MQLFALCKVREWDISYESLTSLQIRARLRNEEADKTELWKELQGSKADQDLPLESKEVAEDVVDEEEGPDDSNITPAAVVADVTVSKKRRDCVARKTKGSGLRSAALTDDIDAVPEPMFEAMDGAEEVKEQGTGRPTQAKKPNRHYLRPGWLSHEDEQDSDNEESEILVEIFCLALDTWSFMQKQHIQKVQALSHVCAYWRCVAHTTPRLWTETLLTRLDKTPKSDYMACMKGWLERLAPMPIAINLEISGKARDTGEALMDIITTTAHQWSDIHLKLPSLSMLSHIPTACLKSLECLTEIKVTDLSPQECLDTLVQCTSIVSARFETGAWPDVPDLSQPPITTLGQLEDLSVSLRGCVVPFFVCLALPALKKLCLDSHMDGKWSPWGSVEFTQFQLRSPSIQCLEISSSYLLSSDLLAVLQHVPLLAELQMDSYPNTFHDFIVGALQYTTQTLPLVPRLEVIQLYYADVNFEEDVLDAMIQSQWWTDEQLLALPSPPKVARWSHIDIHCGDKEENVTGELEAKLEQYRSQGLDVLSFKPVEDVLVFVFLSFPKAFSGPCYVSPWSGVASISFPELLNIRLRLKPQLCPLANTQIHDDPHKPPWIHVTTGWELQFDDGW
ncbi:hypothetical protein B0H14DRAFT_3603971 [Mycena olivaceomarginata]|nr:hypothetical protein B0H14DRAFT_3603971 [Mycena olivaceomarginata]